MATIQNRINNYKVSISVKRNGIDGFAVTSTERVIELSTEPLVHGITRTILMVFSNNFNTFTSPIVGHYSGRDTFAQHVAVWLPLHEFEVNYDLLRHEKPVYSEFDFNESGTLIGYITRFTLTTGTERPGEGDTDVSELLDITIPERFAILSAMGIRTEPEAMTANGQS
ncbi:MAG: hypothetical protein JWP57_1867 [Spirosoma sp.]|nr:hypothetical protein [Spirosoma sp.]